MSRSRRRGGQSGRLRSVAVAVVVVVALWHGIGLRSVAFPTTELPRETQAAVADDETGVFGLDVADQVHINATDPLVNVTNRLGESATVTVALRSDSTDLGDLVVDGTNQGDTVSFSLGDGSTKTVEISVPDDSTLDGETVYFHVNASAGAVDVSAPDRNTTVVG